jgi:hypothetical protein
MINAKKLAAAAREIAMECAAGTAPEMGSGTYFNDAGPCCPVGHVFAKAGARELWQVSFCLVRVPAYIARRSDACPDADRNDAVIFPLLAWADELEAL